MAEIEHDTITPENLLDKTDPLSLNNFPTLRLSHKKHVREVTESKLERREVSGKHYYYFVRGRGEPIYLGTADSILWKVKHIKG